ncbi:P-loop containing nucleoside triphosphate hydrolase protein [Naematelia encephala]|uniref:Kinesin-like protein n=1 Tax=Naematelia encephala TaxID=71784 RepID=A0A1Y2BE79_9TREE|nr:P-loop containing nucleoside triphosphate hydrolase protein [Naematelia encephala]
MSEGQENTAPVSRLPRLLSPQVKTGIPVPSHSAPLLSSNNINKRKLPSSPGIPVAKRQASNPTPTLGPSSAAGLRQSQRKPSGGFVPTANRKPSSALTAASRPTSSLAASQRRTASNGSAASSTASTTTARARAAAAPTTARRPPVATSTRSAGNMGRSLGPGRGVSPGAASGSGIGSGLASVSQFKSHDGRIQSMEKTVNSIQEMWEREQARISSLQMSQSDMQALLANFRNADHQSRRDLSNVNEEMEVMRAKYAREIEDLERQLSKRDREKRDLEEEMKDGREDLSRERETVRELKRTLAEQSAHHLTLNAQLAASQAQQAALQAEIQRATLAVSSMKAELEVGMQNARAAEQKAAEKVKAVEEERDRKIAEIEDELRTAETIRRKLHNQVQELKGNIRVFARVRPALAHESDSPDALADITYGDERTAAETGQSQITVTSRTESATGKEREQAANFVFDKIFQPMAGQKEVFEEISMLAQSVLDGYNVCIFAYGQTGSGKSWTMEGGQNDKDMGMIPRAIDMIFTVSSQLRDRGWKYQMEGQFLEVYNEVINDLLGSGQFDTKKHEIKHDKEGKMSVTDVVSVPLSNPRQVSTLLDRARSRRAVAATLMNERSSRSHSVFTLKVRGVNPLTEEKCEAMLNLVDLAGSERLASSGAGENKDRLKETININKSLSALADVIGALGTGQQGGHVPYRNSTLTRLLQTSLSGSSKTLMLCNLSPLAAHLGETLCSLRFATKVNSTVVGSAKKQTVK